ncbi:MAG: hypothetical protein COT73_00335 [Bdellovibrio sp. CG10_big_fil_rev_8_21_14_0_10_47_8]|nr:MAG: hypothetical protein COT73_00335 [Bdellovibrio sp. CG10_big_fil_rev_8_21_14_0_10_47_8]
MFRLLRKFFVFLRYDPVVVLTKLKITSDSNGRGTLFINSLVERKFRKTGLEELLSRYGRLDQNKDYEFFLSGHKKRDSLYLYGHVSQKDGQDVVEFGSGISTIVMAYAIQQRKNGPKHKVYAVEADAKWATLVQNALKELNLSEYAEVMVSTPRLTNFDGQACSFFDKLPNASPSLIYLDGPDPRSVEGDVHGLSMSALRFMVQADILLYEWSLYAGSKIIVDGRLHNLRFLQKNLKRQYKVRRNYFANVSTLQLIR